MLCDCSELRSYCEFLTFAARSLPVSLADESAVLGEVELVAGGELPGAQGAREAVEVEDVVLRAPHHLRRWNALVAAGAFSAEAPAEQPVSQSVELTINTPAQYSLEKVLFAEDVAVAREASLRQLRAAVGALETPRVPRPVQHLQDEPVQNQLRAAPAPWNRGWNIKMIYFLQLLWFLCL